MMSSLSTDLDASSGCKPAMALPRGPHPRRGLAPDHSRHQTCSSSPPASFHRLGLAGLAWDLSLIAFHVLQGWGGDPPMGMSILYRTFPGKRGIALGL